MTACYFTTAWDGVVHIMLQGCCLHLLLQTDLNPSSTITMYMSLLIHTTQTNFPAFFLSQCNRAVLFKWECLQIGYFPLTNVQSHLFMALSLTVLPLTIRVDGTSCKWESPDKRAVMQLWVLNRRATTMVCMTMARLLSYQSFLLTQEYINIRM